MSDKQFEIIEEAAYSIYEGLKFDSVTSFSKNEWRTETSNGYHMHVKVISGVVVVDLAETEYDLGNQSVALIKIKDRALGAAPSFEKIAEFMNWTCVSEKMWDIV